MIRRDHQELWAVVRLDVAPIERVLKEPRLFITIKEVVPTVEEADSEVARLNELGPAQSGATVYFAARARYFPEGRDVQRGY